MTARWNEWDRNRGAAWYRALTESEKGALGDAFVLGTFDPLDWFTDPPGRAFMRGVVRAWEHDHCT